MPFSESALPHRERERADLSAPGVRSLTLAVRNHDPHLTRGHDGTDLNGVEVQPAAEVCATRVLELVL